MEGVSLYYNRYNIMKNQFIDLAKKCSQQVFENKMHWQRSTMNSLQLQIVSGVPIKDLDITTDNNGKHLLCLSKNKSIVLLPYEESFEILFEAHLATNHGLEDSMKKFTKDYLIPFFCIPLIIQVCDVCAYKNTEPNSWQILTFQLQDKVCQFNSILIYRDVLTNFLFMRPLLENSEKEIAIELIQLFLQYGIPDVLDFCMPVDMTEVTSRIMKIINLMHPPCAKIKCDYKSDLCRYSVEITRITNAITEILQKNASENWMLECHMIQYKLNTSQTIVFNYDGFPVTRGIPSALYLQKAASCNSPEVERKLDALEWDIDNHKFNEPFLSKNVSSQDDYEMFKKISDQITCNLICCVCSKKNCESYTCGICELPVHVKCGIINETKYPGQSGIYNITCASCDWKQKNVSSKD